jgi:hypothetical protein
MGLPDTLRHAIDDARAFPRVDPEIEGPGL